MKLTTSSLSDLEQIKEWVEKDPFHKNQNQPAWWLTGQGLLSFCVQDSKGPVVYVRLDKQDDMLRLNCQFAPEEEVSKLRVMKALIWTFPQMVHVIKQNKLKGFVYKSVNQPLIDFMQLKFSFTPTGNDNDYWLPIEEKT